MTCLLICFAHYLGWYHRPKIKPVDWFMYWTGLDEDQAYALFEDAYDEDMLECGIGIHGAFLWKAGWKLLREQLGIEPPDDRTREWLRDCP